MIAINAASANPHDTHKTTLEVKREKVAQHYIQYLATTNYQDMGTLFTDDAVVISTSQGEKNAKLFFSQFLPQVANAHTELHQMFVATHDERILGARFHLDYLLNDGGQGKGEFVDEFQFADGSEKLTKVMMFENLKFD